FIDAVNHARGLIDIQPMNVIPGRPKDEPGTQGVIPSAQWISAVAVVLGSGFFALLRPGMTTRGSLS
ncbi:hypothetical protein P3H15_54905, partial [Rhodococcus sp. T2V]|uniref:hypothetical protein n=1 Tax=Rhodococcus sp. T2V TaxID=3034164 RepID=UPI0023E16F82